MCNFVIVIVQYLFYSVNLCDRQLMCNKCLLTYLDTDIISWYTILMGISHRPLRPFKTVNCIDFMVIVFVFFYIECRSSWAACMNFKLF